MRDEGYDRGGLEDGIVAEKSKKVRKKGIHYFKFLFFRCIYIYGERGKRKSGTEIEQGRKSETAMKKKVFFSKLR